MVRDKWYNFLIGGVLIILLYIITALLIGPIIRTLQSPNKLLNFANIHLVFTSLLLITIIVTSKYNKINPMLLINWKGKIDFKAILWSFSSCFILLILMLIYNIKDHNTDLIKTTNISLTVTFIFVSLLLTPIQIITEEIVFRGYLVKLLKSIKNNRVFIIIISSTIFALLHMANPEVEQDKKYLFLIVYLLMSLYLTVLTVIFQGIEYSIGIHFANNFFAINFLNYPDSPLPSVPLYMTTAKLDPVKSIISTLILIIITSITIYIREKYVKKHNI